MYKYVPVKRVVGQKQLLCGGRRAYYRLDRMNVVIIVSDPCWVGLSLQELKTGDPDSSGSNNIESVKDCVVI